jgi:hypothetical protein
MARKLRELLPTGEKAWPEGFALETLEERKGRVALRLAEGYSIRAEPGEERWLQRRFWTSYTGEMMAAEGFGRTLVECGELPWETKLLCARQVWDEARHMDIYSRLMARVGSRLNEEPVSPNLFHVMREPDAVKRMAGTRAVEGPALDIFYALTKHLRAAGEERAAFAIDYIIADEVLHNRIAAEAMQAACAGDPERLRAALETYKNVNQRALHEDARGLKGKKGIVTEVNAEARRQAGYSEQEIEMLALGVDAEA